MAADPTQKPDQQTSDPGSERPRADEFPPVPDEDGPHDVPDDQVIEKTLPSTSPDKNGNAP